MLEPDGSPNTAHSLNPVPLVVTVAGLELADGGILADVAPTALALLGIEQPGGDDRAPARRRVLGRARRFELHVVLGQVEPEMLVRTLAGECQPRRS